MNSARVPRSEAVQPFRIAVTDAELEDLRCRLRATRWPDHLVGGGWDYGTDPAYLRELVEYWAEAFDWRREERRLNSYPQFLAEIEGLNVHFVHQRAGGGGGLPVLVLHGWPGSFVQMLDLLPLLAAPTEHGGEGDDAFDVVVGSLPGFGFSDTTNRPGLTEPHMARLFHRLMTEVLGYERYAVRGSDFGGSVAEALATRYPEAVVGIHLSGTTPRADNPPPDPGPAIRQYLRDVERWRASEVGYGAIQSTKPQTPATALNDSPAGLAGWIVEKFRRWSDCDGEVERRFTKDQLLTNISLYWFTATIGSSIRLYCESDYEQECGWDVPTAHLMSSKDMFPTPREWVEHVSRVDRWTAVDRGGHFIEWEEPGLVAEDMRAFFRTLR
ncbi:epoxide hydrolase family protein [Amycolatopsis sp. NPDC051061]|uniref:epoxide hydrolase family protein n=1 Tax=Amycolatopsis sp. NPDC051061 TaxID=3155042 RepID=UPI00343EC575